MSAGGRLRPLRCAGARVRGCAGARVRGCAHRHNREHADSEMHYLAEIFEMLANWLSAQESAGPRGSSCVPGPAENR